MPYNEKVIDLNPRGVTEVYLLIGVRVNLMLKLTIYQVCLVVCVYIITG